MSLHCQKHAVIYAGLGAAVLQTLGAFISIGAMVGPFSSVTVPAVTCPGTAPNVQLTLGQLNFMANTYEVNNNNNWQRNVRYTEGSFVKSSTYSTPYSASNPVNSIVYLGGQSCNFLYPPIAPPYLQTPCDLLNSVARVGDIVVRARRRRPRPRCGAQIH